MGAEHSVSAPRRNQLAVSAALSWPQRGVPPFEDARRGNHELTTAGYPGNVGLKRAANLADIG